MKRAWIRGAAVTIRLDDGTVIKGSVWDEGETEGEVWAALDNGQYARIRTSTGAAQVCDAIGRPTLASGYAA